MGTLTWLDKSFLLKALNNALDIDDFNVLPAITKGNNMLSEVCRVLVHWSNGAKQTTSLFFKLPYPAFEILSRNEIELYTTVLPKMYECLKGNELCPKFYYCSTPENILVLEDLVDSGFRMSRQTTLVDYEHCAAGMQAIAKFHAASIVLQETCPGCVERAGSRGFGSQADVIKLFVDISLRVLAEILDTIPEVQAFSGKLEHIRPRLLASVMDFLATRGPVNVLNHGDFTANNIMFKYGPGNGISEVRIFDFQLPTYGSFAMDLQAFLLSSSRADVLTTRLDDLLLIYQTTLNSTLSDCSSSVRLTFEDVKKEFAKADCFGIYMASTLFAMRAAGAQKTAQVSSFSISKYFEENDSPFRKLMNYEEYKVAIAPVIKYFESRGLFDGTP